MYPGRRAEIMLGLTSSGCFITGIFTGFLLAVVVAIACVFYFNPDLKERGIRYVETFWGQVKDGVDDSIDAVKKAPVADPKYQFSTSGKKPVKAVKEPEVKVSVPAGRTTVAQPAASGGLKAPREVKISW